MNDVIEDINKELDNMEVDFGELWSNKKEDKKMLGKKKNDDGWLTWDEFKEIWPKEERFL